MDYKVIYSPSAISDLAEIVRFVAQDDPQAAFNLGEQLADDADSLAGSLIDFRSSAGGQTFGNEEHTPCTREACLKFAGLPG